METRMIVALSAAIVFTTARFAPAEEKVPIRQSTPIPKTDARGLGTRGYPTLEDEFAFIKKVTEKQIDLAPEFDLPKPAHMSAEEWKKFVAELKEDKKKLIPIAQYELAKQSGQYVGWFGIVRALDIDADGAQTRLLIEHKYFDGLTDLHLQVVSFFGTGDFQVVLPGKVTAEQIPPLALICAYGKVSEGDKKMPILSAEYVRVWDWGLFTFMAYGKDKSNPNWVKLRKVNGEDAYDSRPLRQFYEERLGKR